MHIMPFRIRVQHKEGTAHFRSVHEAIRNKRDLVPAPSTVASNIQRGNVVKPIRLVPLAERSGLYDYALADSEILYWAWVIAKGMDEPMPAFVHGNS